MKDIKQVKEEAIEMFHKGMLNEKLLVSYIEISYTLGKLERTKEVIKSLNKN